MRFVVKHPFYWRGRLVEGGQMIDVPDDAVERLLAMNVLGEPVKAQSDTAVVPEPTENATKAANKARGKTRKKRS